MENRILGDARIQFDPEATANWYANYGGWGCRCGHCRNFLKAAKARALPGAVLDILEELNIAPEKATYVGELFADQEGIHYQFSYRLAGRILEENVQAEHPGAGRCCYEPYPYGAPDFPVPHFDLEFYTTLPWVLEES